MARGQKAGEEVARDDGGLSQESGEEEGFLREDGWISFSFLYFYRRSRILKQGR